MAGEVIRSGPYLIVDAAGWTLRMLVGDAEALASPCDVEVQAPSGDRYTAVAATIEQLAGLMDTWRSSGECLGGDYLWIKNLVVVRSLLPDRLADVVADLVRTGEIEGAMQLMEGEPEEP